MLTIHQARYHVKDNHYFSVPNFQLQIGQHLAIIGENGSGKTTLARVLANELLLLKGRHHCPFQHIVRLSFEQHQQWIAQEWQRTNSDLFNEQDTTSSRTTYQVLTEGLPSIALADLPTWIVLLGLASILSQPLTQLSTGESRKVWLCRALLEPMDCLIIEEPFEGLDMTTQQQLLQWLRVLSKREKAGQPLTLILVVNRLDDIPDFIDSVAWLAEGQIQSMGNKQEIVTRLKQQLSQGQRDGLPAPDSPPVNLPPDIPRVVLKQGHVQYGDKVILDHLDWQVNAGENWHICGANGAGKSTLLSLVTGIHPQSYCNDLHLFGRKRGSGETLWQIKQYIGEVSHQLHLDYRVPTSVRNVILSGFFDEIGLYTQPSDKQKYIANAWLSLLVLSEYGDSPFQSLSWGMQRLILIVRALVKQPCLLILDEPLQGLDEAHRQKVKYWIDELIKRSQGKTQLLFVSHHFDDAPRCITHRLTFVQTKAGYDYQQSKV